MKKNPSGRPQWLFTLLVGAIVCGYVFLFFLPGERATAELRRQLLDQQQYVVDSAPLSAEIARVEAELARTRQYRDAWHEASSSEARLAHVFVLVTEHADAARTEIMRFEPQPPETFDYLRRVPVTMALEGTFKQVCDFLSRLESLDAELWVESLHMDGIPTRPGRLRCELRLALFAGAAEISD